MAKKRFYNNLCSNPYRGFLAPASGKTRIMKNVKKVHVLSKKTKTRDGKMFKSFYYHYKLCSNLLSNSRGGSLTPRAKKTLKNDESLQRLKKL